MRKPPLLPIEVLDRVLRLARLDGIMILALAGGYAAMAALAKNGGGLALGIVVTAAGAMELLGVEYLNNGQERGLRWLLGSQLYLLAVILLYAFWRYHHVDLALLRQAVTPEMKAALTEVGWNQDDFLVLANRLTYSLFALVSLAYQGGMAWYYWRRRHAVRQALAEEI